MLNIDDRLLSDLDESEMYLVLHIAKFMTANRMTAWPSLETLSKNCNWDERTVKKHRQSLVLKGYLEMKMQPGKPTMYRFLKDGIGVYRPMKTDEMIAENEGTYFEGGTKNEGTQNVFKGVQKMRGEVVNNIEVIKRERGEKEKTALPPSETSTLEAEKEKAPPVAPAPPVGTRTLEPPFSHVATIEPQQPRIVRLNDPELPGVELIEPAPQPIPNTYNPRSNPAEKFGRVDIAAEIEELKTDPAAKEAFAMSRKIPSQLFEEYVDAFRLDVLGRGETYNSKKDFRRHFFSWSGVRYEIAQKAQTKNGATRAHLTPGGANPAVYLEKQKF